MSAVFILEYKSKPVKFDDSLPRIGGQHEPTTFTDAASAWWAAYKAGLDPSLCQVRQLAHTQTKGGPQ